MTLHLRALSGSVGDCAISNVGDGDLDVLTCEEREAGRGLGVFWYENVVPRR